MVKMYYIMHLNKTMKASAGAGVACAVSGPIWGNLVDSGASRKWLLQARKGFTAESPQQGLVAA